jgi:hypothetical protein
MKMVKSRGKEIINVAMALALVAMLGAAFLPLQALASPDTITYYFNGYDANECWGYDPAYMTDGSTGTYAYTNMPQTKIQLNNSNTCPGTALGVINQVEIRAYGYGDGEDYIYLRPVFTGGDGNNYEWVPGTTASWSPYYDITNDPNAPSSWTWTDVQNLDVDVEYCKVKQRDYMHIARVEIRVTYMPPPTVNSVTLTDISMTPQMEHAVSVNVSYAGGKAGLETLVLKVYYDSDGGTPTDAEAEGQTADSQNCAIITWTESSDTFAIEPSSSTTWSLGTCSSPASLPGDFTFVFTPGKVAAHTTGSAVWQIWAKATDDVSQTDTGYDDTPPAMNWYGEVTVDTPSVDWGTVDLGSGFSDNPQADISVTYICNGTYDQQVKSDGSWSGSGVSITLDAAGSPGVKEFSMKADDTAVLGSAVLVSTSYVTIDSGSQTGEAGNTESANTLWLKMGASGIPAVTYNGTIYYQIAP